MAITSCPSCSKAISDKHPACPHCHEPLQNLDEEQRARLKSRRYVAKKQSLMNHSFIALIIFLGGFLYLYAYQPSDESIEMNLTYGAITVGFVWYLVNRIRILLLKKK